MDRTAKYMGRGVARGRAEGGQSWRWGLRQGVWLHLGAAGVKRTSLSDVHFRSSLWLGDRAEGGWGTRPVL